MSKRRKRIGKGIYRDADGVSASVKVGTWRLGAAGERARIAHGCYSSEREIGAVPLMHPEPERRDLISVLRASKPLINK